MIYGSPRTNALSNAVYLATGVAIHQGDPYGDAILLASTLERENAAPREAFKDAWEVFQSDFIQAADLDQQHGGAWIIADAQYERIRRKVNAVIGAALKSDSPARWTCPVCEYDRLRHPPENHHICPSCGTQFDYDDGAKTHAELRAEWIAGGRKWWSEANKPEVLPGDTSR